MSYTKVVKIEGDTVKTTYVVTREVSNQKYVRAEGVVRFVEVFQPGQMPDGLVDGTFELTQEQLMEDDFDQLLFDLFDIQ